LLPCPSDTPEATSRPSLPAFIAATALGVIVLGTLFWAVAPISSDDLWWHLSLGEAFSKHGPWLESAGVERGLTVGMVAAWLVTVLVAVLGLNGFGTWRTQRSTYW
jgi:hypothetical protein